MTNRYLLKELVTIAGIPEIQASIMNAKAHRLGIEDKPLPYIISKTGAMSAAAADNLNNLKRSYPQRGDNSPMSTQKGNPGVLDKKYKLSNYSSVDDCVNGPNGLVSLGVDSDRAKTECNSYFSDGKMSDKNTVSGNHLLQTVKTSKTINVHSAANNDWITYGQNARSKGDIEPEEVPAWAATMIGGPPNLIKSSSTNRIKSASEIGDNVLYNYMQARQISHRDDIKGVPVNLELEEMIQKKANLLATKSEIHRLKNAKREAVDPRPAWLICLED